MHRRILVGMVLGVVIGALLGPRSLVLSRDSIRVGRQGRLSLSSVPGGREQAGVVAGPTVLRIVGRKDLGKATWYHVRDAAGHSGWVSAEEAPAAFSGLGDRIVGWVRPIGLIFLRLLKMLVVPLVFASLVVGVFSLGDIRRLGRVGLRTFGYYLVTTALAIVFGLVLVNLVRPGRFVGAESKKALAAWNEQFDKPDAAGRAGGPKPAEQSLSRRLVEVVPENPVSAAADGRMLQIIFFALFFGVVLLMVPGDGPARLVGLLDTVNEAMIKGVGLVMEVAPFGVAALLADVVGSTGLRVLLALGVYSLVVLAGLLLHVTVTYGLAVRTLARISFRRFLRAVRPAQFLAFSTSSSAATLPVSMECAEDNLGVSGPITSFVLPLGATVNMDGTALYQAVAAVFVAQVFGVHLSLASQLAILLAALLASIGAAAVPSSSIVLLAMVLQSANIPAAGIALILGMDRILDMFRTAVNVTGDLSAAVVMARWEGEDLKPVQDES